MDRLLEILENADLHLTPTELADVLWLAGLLQSSGPAPAGLELSSVEPTASAPLGVDKPPASDLEEEDSADVHPYRTEQEETSSRSELRGVPFRSPAVSALPNELRIGKSIRP